MHIARLEAEVEALDLSIESEEEEEDEVGELVSQRAGQECKTRQEAEARSPGSNYYSRGG